MAQRKQWTAQKKLNIVLQGLRGDVKISELCNDHGITQAMYYEWKNLLLTQGTRICERGGVDHERERLEKENRKLKETIGELHVELKKRLAARRRRRQRQFYLDMPPEVERLKGEHPSWGVRRVTAYLKKYVDKRVNHKGIAWLMKDNGLTVPRNTALRARREPKTRKPVTDMPDTVWGTDMTRTRTAQGWAYVHVVLDWGSKKLLAPEASPTSRSSDWIRVMDKAVDMQFPDGIDRSDPYRLFPTIVGDNGCQPTSKAFAEYEKALGLEHIFTSYCNPKGDADTERVIRTIKEDLLWINEFKTLDELKEALGKWQHDYNHVFPHSSLEYCTPVEYEERWNCGTEPQNTRAKKILRKESLFEPMNQNRGLCNAAP